MHRNETSIGSAGSVDGGGLAGGSSSDHSPFQARARFLENWRWELVVALNRGACGRGGATHGFNSEAQGACEGRWENLRPQELSIIETLDELRAFHRAAPFLFLNGCTFAALANTLLVAVFAEADPIRRREIADAGAGYVSGVRDRAELIALTASLCEDDALAPGDAVQTLRGSATGIVVRVIDDGRITWRSDATQSELTGTAASLRRR